MAEAELEYPENHVSKSIYVGFKITSASPVLQAVLEKNNIDRYYSDYALLFSVYNILFGFSFVTIASNCILLIFIFHLTLFNIMYTVFCHVLYFVFECL